MPADLVAWVITHLTWSPELHAGVQRQASRFREESLIGQQRKFRSGCSKANLTPCCMQAYKAKVGKLADHALALAEGTFMLLTWVGLLWIKSDRD